MGNSNTTSSTSERRYIIEKLESENYNRIIYPPNLKGHIESLLSYFKESVLKKYDVPLTIKSDKDKTIIEYYIPKGTRLYHGSLDFNLQFTDDRITFFGIDIIISLWYLLELRRYNKYGVIYEFEVVEDIPVYLLEDITNHPFNWYGTGTKCRIKEFACIHPQYAYHGTPDNFGELSSEITINLSYDLFKHAIKNIIHPKTNKPIIYVVDLDKLEQYRTVGDFTIHQFNPIEPNKSINQTILSKVRTKLNGKLNSVMVGMLQETKTKSSIHGRNNNGKKKGGGKKYKKRTRKNIKTYVTLD
jgi:hypothetical protein